MKLFFQVRICLFQLVFINSTRSFPFFLRRCSWCCRSNWWNILKWKEPYNNGAVIIEYSVYQRFVNNNEWKKIATIIDVYNRSYAVEIEKGKEYEFVVTATNKYGESSMEQDIKRIKVLDGRCINNLSSFLWQSQRILKVVLGCTKFPRFWNDRRRAQQACSLSHYFRVFFTKKVYRMVLLGEKEQNKKNCSVW